MIFYAIEWLGDEKLKPVYRAFKTEARRDAFVQGRLSRKPGKFGYREPVAPDDYNLSIYKMTYGPVPFLYFDE